MGKADFGSAKFQAKQLKASGLQRLRYYCQLCQKQCRDANGFKNHLLSPSHTGRISNLSKDGKAASVVGGYLAQFERDFMRLLRINHGTKKINANKFYQEYILNDRDHVHMNATKWLSLTSFVRHLGRLGKLRVEIPDEDDEFNLVIRLPDTTAPAKKEKREADEERSMKFLQHQIDRGRELEEQQALRHDVTKSHLQDSQDANASNVDIESKPNGSMKFSLKGLSARKPTVALAFADDSDSDS